MKSILDDQIKVHAFVCTNERPPGGKPCCHKAGGTEFFSRLKERLKAEGIYKTHKVTRSGCLNYCNSTGCTVVIYEEGKAPVWKTEVTAEDFDRIYQEISER